jgi:hypothetical protein
MVSHCKDQAQESRQSRHFEEQVGSSGSMLNADENLTLNV